MTRWPVTLKGDPMPWLLEPGDPSVRYWALVDLLERPETDPEVRAARAAIARQTLVQDLFARQHRDGHWGDDPAAPYRADGAVGVLGLLCMLGVSPDERTAAGCDSLLEHAQHECGGLSIVRTQRSGIMPCTTGLQLPLLARFGRAGDPRVRRAFAFVIEDMAAPDALECGRYEHRECLWGAIAALDGLALLPADMRTPQARKTVKRLAEALLGADYDFAGEHKRWLTFGVPRAWDLLSALLALAAHGYGRDRRFRPLLDLVLAQQDEQGRWRCGSVSRTWPLEKRNRPSKWVTLDALRLLKRTSATA